MRSLSVFALAAALLTDGVVAAAQTSAKMPLLQSIAGDVRTDELHATISKLVGFGTRHTLSDAQSKTRGIGAARRWVKSRFEEINRSCDGCLQIETPEQNVTGERIPKQAAIVDVLAIQRGTTDPDRVIVISGHIDSRVRDVMDATSDAPGADDDGSGTAAVLEAARVLSKHKVGATLVYAVLSGEEQGLYGGKLLAQYARDHHWNVEADLNNDIVGNTLGTNGVKDATHVRLFSEGTRSTETSEEATRRRYNGGEVDSPSRNLARFISGLATSYLQDFSVRMVYRTDRYSRGGDQVPMLAAGYPAVRFTEAIENYTREHQDVRVENGVHYGDVLDAVDFPYLAQVTRLNAISMAALAMAPAPPTQVKIEGAVSMDTNVSWAAVPGAASYRVWWRDTTAPYWSDSRLVGATSALLKDVNIDDWFFGVSSVSGDGYESPVEFPGPAGAFSAGTSDDRQAQVRERGAEVMTFSLGATLHVFQKTEDGGVQKVLAREGHSDQVPMIRSHLQAIAEAFRTRDFSGPTHVHGAGMPGLAELKAAAPDELAVSYQQIDDGAQVSYLAKSPATLAAVHKWFDAQLADHGADASDHR